MHQPEQASLYRPDIDGLRAIAVIAVVVFHAFPKLLPGGFIGVDIFFVISGFLISGIILRGLDDRTFAFADFYARRIKRIFPALLIVLSSCLAIGWFFLFADEYAHLGKHTAAGAGFISNFMLLGETGYFDISSEFKPLLHLWSLSIEEQFYLLWPLLLFWIRPRGVYQALALVVTILVASFVFGIHRLESDPAGAFYLSAARAWELLTGAVLAFLYGYGPAKALGARWASWSMRAAPTAARIVAAGDVRACAGLGLIALVLFTFDRQTAFPGLNALLPTLGALLLISAGPAAWINRTILANRSVVFVGLISYPLYLWHWPVLAFARIADAGAPSAPVLAGAVVLSTILAFLTYRFIEKPIRASRTRYATLALVGAGIAIGAAGFFASSSGGMDFRSIAKAARYDRDAISRERSARIRFPQCHFDTDNQTFAVFRQGVDRCLAMHSDRKNVMVMGDSHGADLYSALSHAFPDVNFLQVTGSGCTPVEEVHKGAVNRCRALIQYAKYQFGGLRKLDGIVLTARWKDDFKQAMRDVTYFRSLGLPVLVFGPTVEFSSEVPKIVQRSRSAGRSIAFGRYTVPEVLDRDRRMKAFFLQQHVPYVSKVDAICANQSCTVLSENYEYLFIDDAHWTTRGGDRFGEYFARHGALETVLAPR